MKDFTELRILNAVHEVLTGRVNELIRDSHYNIPIIEFGHYIGRESISPVITLSSCEQTEKERIVRLE